MAKATPDAILDAMFDVIIASATALYVCSDQPANFAAIAGVALADSDLGTGDFSKGNGDASGRKLTIAQQSNLDIDTSGTATHVVLASADTLLYVTTCSSQVLTEGGTVTVPAWAITVADPS